MNNSSPEKFVSKDRSLFGFKMGRSQFLKYANKSDIYHRLSFEKWPKILKDEPKFPKKLGNIRVRMLIIFLSWEKYMTCKANFNL